MTAVSISSSIAVSIFISSSSSSSKSLRLQINRMPFHKLLHPVAVGLEVFQIALRIDFRLHRPCPGDQVGSHDHRAGGHRFLVSSVETMIQGGYHVDGSGGGGGDNI